MTETEPLDAAAPELHEGRSSAPPAPGEQLRAERLRQGLSVADIAQRLKFAPRQVEALEAGEHAALPGLTFERGFVRGYAKLLGIDAAPLVAELERLADARGGPTTVQLQSISAGHAQFPVSASSHASAWPWLLAILIAVAGVGGYSIYHWTPPESLARTERATAPAATAGPVVSGSVTGAQQGGSPVTANLPAPAALPHGPENSGGANVGAAPSDTGAAGQMPAVGQSAQQAPSAVPAQPAPMPAGAGGSAALRLVFSGESWTEIRDGAGRVVFSRKSAAGSEHLVEGQAPFDLVIGNARDVKVFYRGSEVDLAPYIKVSVARLQLK